MEYLLFWSDEDENPKFIVIQADTGEIWKIIHLDDLCFLLQVYTKIQTLCGTFDANLASSQYKWAEQEWNTNPRL